MNNPKGGRGQDLLWEHNPGPAPRTFTNGWQKLQDPHYEKVADAILAWERTIANFNQESERKISTCHSYNVCLLTLNEKNQLESLF